MKNFGYIQDEKLIDLGYEPIPLNGKRPVTLAWQTRWVTKESIAADRLLHPFARDTGLRTGRLVGIDIDVDDPALADQIRSLVYQILPHSPFDRVGRRGGMLCYRNEEPIGKIVVGNKQVKVEILGIGQQFVAYGIHEVTRKAYDWVNSRTKHERGTFEWVACLPEPTPS